MRLGCLCDSGAVASVDLAYGVAGVSRLPGAVDLVFVVHLVGGGGLGCGGFVVGDLAGGR